MCKHRIFKKSCIFLTTIFFFLLLKANFGAAEDKAVLISKDIYTEDSSFKSLFNEDEAGKNGFADGEYLFDLKEEYFVDLLSSDQTHQDETATKVLQSELDDSVGRYRHRIQLQGLSAHWRRIRG